MNADWTRRASALTLACSALFATLVTATANAASPSLTVEYLGHASFLLTDAAGRRLLTDPFLDGYPLPFPESLSVDLVAVGGAGPDHAAVHQVRGNPQLLEGPAAKGTFGSWTVSAVVLGASTAGGRAAIGYEVEAPGSKLVLLGEARDESPELVEAVRGADVVFVSPLAAPGLLRFLARGRRTLVPLLPDALHGDGGAAGVRQRVLSALPAVRVAEARALRVGADLPGGVVILRRRALPTRPPAAGDCAFGDTLASLTWPQVARAAKEGATVLLPVGTVEQHGPHMGLVADTCLALRHAALVKRRLARRGTEALVAPPVYWGITDDTSSFPGSFDTRPETMGALLRDVCGSLQRWGFRSVVLVNMHGNRRHRAVVGEAAAAARRELGLQAWDLDRLESPAPPHEPPRRADAYVPDYHAGASETRLMADSYPGQVDLRLARKLQPEPAFEPLGYAGDPASFAREDGVTAALDASAEADALKIALALGRPSLALDARKQVSRRHLEPEALRVVRAHVEAIGGREKVAAIAGQMRVGTLQEGERLSALEVRSAAGRWTFATKEERFLFDGRLGWREERGQWDQMSAERIAFLACLLDVHSALSLADDMQELRVLPTTDPRERRLLARTASGVALELAFDAATGLLRRVDDAVLDDYREVAGVRWPFLLDVGHGHLVARFESITSRADLTPGDFERQAAPEPASGGERPPAKDEGRKGADGGTPAARSGGEK